MRHFRGDRPAHPLVAPALLPAPARPGTTGKHTRGPRGRSTRPGGARGSSPRIPRHQIRATQGGPLDGDMQRPLGHFALRVPEAPRFGGSAVRQFGGPTIPRFDSSAVQRMSIAPRPSACPLPRRRRLRCHLPPPKVPATRPRFSPLPPARPTVDPGGGGGHFPDDRVRKGAARALGVAPAPDGRAWHVRSRSGQRTCPARQGIRDPHHHPEGAMAHCRGPLSRRPSPVPSGRGTWRHPVMTHRPSANNA